MYMCSISELLLAVITLKYYTYVHRCWSFSEIFFLFGFSAMFMSFLPCFSPSKQNLHPCIIFLALKPLTILKHIAEQTTCSTQIQMLRGKQYLKVNTSIWLLSWRTICTQKRSHQNCSVEKPPSTLPISLKIVILSHDIRALLDVCFNTSCLFPCAVHLETMHTWLSPILLQASYTWNFSLLTW